MALVTQIYSIVNDAVKDSLAKTNGITKLNTTDFVSMGKAIDEYDLYESFYGSLVNRITKTVFFVRSYEGNTRNILRDESEYGAFVQKVYYKLPDAVENPTWNIPQVTPGESGSPDVVTYGQASPYDVEGTIGVSALIYGGQGTWSIEVLRPIEQIRTAFINEASMAAFIDGLYTQIENSVKLEQERLVAAAVNTAMASALDGGKSRNLLSEFNGSTGTLTVAEALKNADFLKYATKEIKRTIDNMAIMSTAFNKAGYETFTSRDNLVLEALTEFQAATDTYLQSDVYHNELTALPNMASVPFWQTSGTSFAFADTSKISIKNDGLSEDIVQGGIIAFVHDVENVAAYFGKRRSWEIVNPRSEVVVHGEKAEKGFAVDDHANAVVFYIA